MEVQEAQIVFLQQSPAGELWCSTDMVKPCVVADQSVFVSELTKKEDLHVRTLGTHDNVQLICDLYRQRCSPRHKGKLEVASPLLCQPANERTTPEKAIYRMRQCLQSPSLGGWHQVDELDFPAYSLAEQISKEGNFTDHVQNILLTHPVYHDLQFIPTIDMEAVAKLIASVLDPRWFVHANHPYRISKLRNYLGLLPYFMEQVDEEMIDNPKVVNAKLVRQAWKNVYIDDVDFRDPANFLWRRWRAYGGGSKGDLAACRAFLVYLVRNWQNHLLSKSPQKIDMFEPSFLLNAEETAAYKAYKRNS